MLNNKLKIVLVIVITAILVGGISVYATYNYFAKDIIYKKMDGTQINVEDALNELYLRNKTLTLVNNRFGMDVSVGATHTEDLSTFENYQNISEEDFLIVINGYAPAQSDTTTSSVSADFITKSYNKTTGILTITAPRSAYNHGGLYLVLSLYLYK